MSAHLSWAYPFAIESGMVLNHHTGVYISCQPEVGIQSDPLPDFATALMAGQGEVKVLERKVYV